VSNAKYGYIGGVESSQGGSGNSGVFSTSDVQDLVLDDLYGVNKVTRGLLFEYDAKDGGMSGTSVLDISGNGLHATAYNGLSISTSGTYDYGGAFNFDSANDYMQRNYNSGMSGWTSKQTIVHIMRTGDISGRRNIWDQAYGGLGTMTHEPADTINYYYGTNGGNGSTYTNLNTGSITSLNNVVVMHLTRQSGGKVTWYKNGSQISQHNTAYNAANGGQNVRIGVGYTGDYWGGKMYVIKAYTEALTSAEVAQEYNYYKARFGLS